MKKVAEKHIGQEEEGKQNLVGTEVKQRLGEVTQNLGGNKKKIKMGDLLDGEKKQEINTNHDQDEAVSPSNMSKQIEKEDMKKVVKKYIGQDAEE